MHSDDLKIEIETDMPENQVNFTKEVSVGTMISELAELPILRIMHVPMNKVGEDDDINTVEAERLIFAFPNKEVLMRAGLDIVLSTIPIQDHHRAAEKLREALREWL